MRIWTSLSLCVNYTGEGPTAGREVRRFSHLSGQIQPSWWGSCLCTFSLTFTHSLVHLLTHSHTLPLTNLYTHSSAHPSPTHAFLSSSQTIMHTHSLTLTHSHLLTHSPANQHTRQLWWTRETSSSCEESLKQRESTTKRPSVLKLPAPRHYITLAWCTSRLEGM